MVQYKAEYGGGIDEYESIISKQGVKSIEFLKDVVACELGVKVEALPTAEETQDFLNMLQRALDAKEIRPEDWTECRSILNIKKANRYLIHKRKLYAKEQMEQRQQEESMIAEREATTIQAAAEAESTKSNAKAEAEIKVLTVKYRLEKELETHKKEMDLERISKTGQMDERKIVIANEEAQKVDGAGGLPKGLAPKVFTDPAEASLRTD
jgi:hypothetical protein